MSRCLFIHDFFQDGRLDVLAEVRILEHAGQWTCSLRASWIKEVVATHARLKRTQHPGVSYFAGRLAALKSGLTADCWEPGKPPEPEAGLMIFRPLPPDTDRFCGLFDCGSDAIWGLSLSGERHLFVLLCDACRQEWERSETAYVTASGWDWDDDEDLPPFPVVQSKSHQLAAMQQDAMTLGKIVLPLTFSLGFDLSNLLWPVSRPTLLGELGIVLLVAVLSPSLLRFLFDFHQS